MSREIRCLQINDEDLDAGDASTIIRLFRQAVAKPKDAKELRASICFEFGRFDKDPRPNHTIPEIRRFIQQIDHQHPYFCYFLLILPGTAETYSWFMSLLTPLHAAGIEESKQAVDPVKLVDIVTARIRAVRELCTRIFDDPTETEEQIFAFLPSHIAVAVRETLAAR
jgi:hypothetical protein